jgi:hypothetical protein
VTRLLLVIALTASCAQSPPEERAALCEDLVNLAATVDLFARPPDDATVGDVRGAIEKLGPTIQQAEDAGVVADTDADAFRARHEAALEALEDYGDDERFAKVPPESVAATDTLAATYRRVLTSLGCDTRA